MSLHFRLRQNLLTALALGFFASCGPCTSAETANTIAGGDIGAPTCRDGTFENYNIWGPQDQSAGEWTVTKWASDIEIIVIDDTSGSRSAAILKEYISELIPEFTKYSHVNIILKPSVDKQEGNVIFLISDDMVRSSKRFEKARINLLRSGGLEEQRAKEIISGQDKFFEQRSPLCGGFVATNKVEGVEGGFVFVAADQDKECVVTALSAIFGIEGNARNLGRDAPVKQDVVSRLQQALNAVKEMYYRDINTGMNDADVRRVMKAVCK